MDVRYPEEAEAYRKTVKEFLADNLPQSWTGIGSLPADEAAVFTQDWRAILYRNGFLAVTWPKHYGGAGLSELEQVVLAEELARAGVPAGGPHDRFGIKMLGNTLLKWGTEEQKRHFLPRILSGVDRWCQGFSEPGAGSDLAALNCQGRQEGGDWVINGQKVWTSAAREANWIFLLVRTNTGHSGHHGISFLLVPMEQTGVEVRPIRMMTGGSEFNETFFTNARTRADNVVGEIDRGWSVAMTLLGFERGEAASTFPIVFREELDRLVKLARERGLDRDPIIRQRLIRRWSEVKILQLLGFRALTGILVGEAPGPAASITKLKWSEHHRVITELAVDVLGAEALVPSGRAPTSMVRTDDPGAPNDPASWVGTFFNARAGTIYAGTSEIQRNVIAEMVLGLPKEPRVEGERW